MSIKVTPNIIKSYQNYPVKVTPAISKIETNEVQKDSTDIFHPAWSFLLNSCLLAWFPIWSPATNHVSMILSKLPQSRGKFDSLLKASLLTLTWAKLFLLDIS